MAHRMPLFAGLALVAALAAGCPEEEACRVGSDCASRVCLSNGTCGPKVRADAATDAEVTAPEDAATAVDAGQDPGDVGAPAPDAGTSEDVGGAEADASPADLDAAQPGADAGQPGPDGSVMPPDAAAQTCAPNADGVITRAELPIVIGASLTMRVAQDVTVNTAGTTRPDGTRVWDLSGALPGDHDVKVETRPVAGQWFAASFPSADYTVRLTGSADTLGVMELGADSLLLQGMASPADGAAKTDLVYDTPIPTLAWPLQTGTEWTGKGIIDGYFEGTNYHCDDVNILNCTPSPNCCIRHVYTSKVDGAGELITPYGTFQVLRVKTTIEYQGEYYYVWTKLKLQRAYAFVTECYGTVAVITSQDDETEAEFTTAAEVRRLAP